MRLCITVGLVHIPNGFNLLLPSSLGLAHVHVPRLLCASGDLQELVELQYAALAAGPSLASFVEDRVAWVVDTLFVVAGN